MIRRAANPALFLTLVVALVVAAFSISGSLALFTDTDSVPGNTFTTAASFSGVNRANAWTTGLTHTAGSGSDRLLLFVVGYENGSDPGVSAVTYGGQSLTPIIGAVAGTSIFGRVELWYLNEAGIAAASGNTFSVTWGVATPSQPMYAAATYKNVNQSSPISDTASNSTDTSTPNPITATVNVTDGAMAVSGAISGNNGSYTWGGGWSEGTDQTSGSTTTMSSAEHAAVAAGTDTASATHSGPNRQAIVAAVINPAGVQLANAWTTGLTHTAGSGGNRLLVFIAGMENGMAGASPPAGDRDLTAVTYGGQSLTPAAEVVVCSGSPNSFCIRTELWYLEEAGIQAATGSTFSPTWSGDPPFELEEHYTAVTLKNVDQISPIGNSSTNGTTTANPIQTSSALVVGAGDLVVVSASAGSAGSYTPGSGYTEGTDQSALSSTMASAYRAIAADGTQQPSMQFGLTINRQVILAAVIKVAP